MGAVEQIEDRLAQRGRERDDVFAAGLVLLEQWEVVELDGLLLSGELTVHDAQILHLALVNVDLVWLPGMDGS